MPNMKASASGRTSAKFQNLAVSAGRIQARLRLPWTPPSRVLPPFIAVSLMLLPFFWLGTDAFLGGDDTRLYFVYPSEWVERFALSAFGNGGLHGFGGYSPQTFYVPFLVVLAVVGDLAPWLNLQALAFGISLSSGFLGTYFTVMLLTRGNAEIVQRRIAASLAGVMYVTAPLIVVMYWVQPLAWIVGVGGAPVLIALSLRYFSSGGLGYLFAFAILSPLFAVGLFALPISLPYVIGALLVVLGGTLLQTGRPERFLRRATLMVVVFMGVNAFWIIPLAKSLVTPGSFGALALGHSGESIAYNVRTVAQAQSIFDTLLLLPSIAFLEGWGWTSAALWGWWGASLPLSLMLPAVIARALMIARAQNTALVRLFVAILMATLVLAYFQTVNVTTVGVEAFVVLATKVPGFAMFRNFYAKFPGAYVFCYSLTFALAFVLVQSRLPTRWQRPASVALALAIVLPGVPMLLGMPLSLPFGTSYPYTMKSQFPPAYMEAMSRLSEIDPAGRVFEMPLSGNYWSILPLASADSVYVGSSPVKFLSGLDTFNSIDSFAVEGLPELETRVERALDDRDYSALGAILRMLSIGNIIFVEGLQEDMGGRFLRLPTFPRDAVEMAEFARASGAEMVMGLDGADPAGVELYRFTEHESLPRLFVADRVGAVGSVEELIAEFSPEGYATSIETGTSGCTSVPVSSVDFANPDDLVICASHPRAGAVEWSRPTPWRYLANVATEGPALLVLAEPFSSDWRASIRPSGTSGKKTTLPKTRVNGYASAWILAEAGEYFVELYYEPQRLTWTAAAVTGLTVLAAGMALVPSLARQIRRNGVRRWQALRPSGHNKAH